MRVGVVNHRPLTRARLTHATGGEVPEQGEARGGEGRSQPLVGTECKGGAGGSFPTGWNWALLALGGGGPPRWIPGGSPTIPRLPASPSFAVVVIGQMAAVIYSRPRPSPTREEQQQHTWQRQQLDSAAREERQIHSDETSPALTGPTQSSAMVPVSSRSQGPAHGQGEPTRGETSKSHRPDLAILLPS